MSATDKIISKYEMIDMLAAVSAANVVPVKYVKSGDYLLSRQECALLCAEIFHLTGQKCLYTDVPALDKYNGAIGAVTACGIMQAYDTHFYGSRMVTEDEAREIAQASYCYLKELRASYRPFKATALQFNPKLFQKEDNTSRLYAEVEKAFKAGAKLVVVPETVISSYVYFDRQEISPYVETVPGESTDLFSGLTKKYRGYLAMGIAEVDADTGNFYNAGALIGPEGYIGKYRKSHQWETEKHWSVDGDLGVPVFGTELGNIAMIICIDASYYEVSRLAAVNGADIILYLTTDSGQAIWSLPARAAQNGVYMVSANRSDTEKGFATVGGSSVWGPEGEKLAEGEVVSAGETAQFETQHVSAVIDPKRYTNANKLRLFDRKPEIYKDLMLTIAPWDKRKSVEGRDVSALSLQYEPVFGDKEANKKKIRRLVEEAYERDRMINLIVLPELSLVGAVSGGTAEAEAFAEELACESTEFFAGLAAEYKAALVFSMVEKADGRLFHTAVVVENDGSVLGTYRKTHLNIDEKNWAFAGMRVASFPSKSVGRIGVILGDEYLFPEIYGLLQVKRADLIAMPQAYVGGGGKIEASRKIVARAYREGAVMLWDSIAIGAQAYLVAANYTGTEKKYAGGSGLYTLEPIYGKDIPKIAGREETGFITRFETLAAQKWWMDQEKMVCTRRTAHYKPLII